MSDILRPVLTGSGDIDFRFLRGQEILSGPHLNKPAF